MLASTTACCISQLALTSLTEKMTVMVTTAAVITMGEATLPFPGIPATSRRLIGLQRRYGSRGGCDRIKSKIDCNVRDPLRQEVAVRVDQFAELPRQESGLLVRKF
jgi:hypothetical protein